VALAALLLLVAPNPPAFPYLRASTPAL